MAGAGSLPAAATPDDLVRARGIDLKEVDVIQIAGIGLASLLLILIVGATFAIVWFAALVQLPTAPAVPSPPNTENLAIYKELVEVYKSESDLQVSRFTQIYQPVVVTVLLPVLTAVIGYTFGSKK